MLLSAHCVWSLSSPEHVNPPLPAPFSFDSSFFTWFLGMPDSFHFSHPLNLSGCFLFPILTSKQECFRATCYSSSLSTLPFDHSYSPVGLNIICKLIPKLVFPTQICPLNSDLYIQLLLYTSIWVSKRYKQNQVPDPNPCIHPPCHTCNLPHLSWWQLLQLYCLGKNHGFILDSSPCFSYTISKSSEN